MLTNHFVVQKITHDSQVILYQAHSDYLNWQFETRRKPEFFERKETFPFVFDRNISIRTSNAGSETSALVRDKQYLVFNDKYGVPAGIGIGILFPEGFAPNVFKFAERPQIPLRMPNNLSTSPPGYFDVFYNRYTKQSAIVFMIGSPTYFEFRCAARYIEGEFPKQKTSSYGNDTLKLTLGADDIGKKVISSSDLLEFSQFFKPNTDLDDVKDKLNRLIELSQERKSSENQKEISRLKKALNSVIFVTEYSSAIVQLLDSYSSGGVVHQVIAKILSYLIM